MKIYQLTTQEIIELIDSLTNDFLSEAVVNCFKCNEEYVADTDVKLPAEHILKQKIEQWILIKEQTAPRYGETIRVCENCGSEQVQIKAWVNANTFEFIDEIEPDSVEDNWCEQCNGHHYIWSKEDYLKHKKNEHEETS